MSVQAQRISKRMRDFTLSSGLYDGSVSLYEMVVMSCCQVSQPSAIAVDIFADSLFGHMTDGVHRSNELMKVMFY